MIFVGVDPGMSGAIAILAPGSLFPFSAFNLKDAPLKYVIRYLQLRMEPEALVLVEKVWGRPGQGGSSPFKFGLATGQVRGICMTLGYLCYEISPQAWQKEYFPGSKTKAQLRDKAIELYGYQAEKAHIRITLQNADAILIAEYLRRAYSDPERMKKLATIV